MCVFMLLTVNSDGCGGKGGTITLGLQMGFPQEGHAPAFSKTKTKANMAADLALHLKGSAHTSIAGEVLVVSSCVMSKGLLLGLWKLRRLYPQGQGLDVSDVMHKDFLLQASYNRENQIA